MSEAHLLKVIQPYLPPGRRALPPSSPVDHLYSLIGGGAGPRPGVRRLNIVYAGGERLTRAPELAGALDELESGIRLDVAINAPRRLFIHAGAVGIARGGLILPGRSRAGKSTLTSALLRAGATYFSDEYAVLDPNVRIHPYAQQISLWDDDERTQNRRVPAAEMGADTAIGPAPVRLVLVTRYQAGVRFRPRRLSQGRALMAILPHLVPARFRPQSTVAGLSRLVERVPVFLGARSDTESVLDWLEREGWLQRRSVVGTPEDERMKRVRADEADTTIR